MAVGLEDASRRFIETEPVGMYGEAGEEKVWSAFKKSFSGRICLGYWRYPVFSKTGDSRKEPDILMVDRELGLVVCEVKSLSIDQITSIQGHSWAFQNYHSSGGSPYKQAEQQLYALLSYCDREDELRRKVRGRVVVALPEITEAQWKQRGFDKLPSCPPIIFKDQLSQKTLISVLNEITPVQSGNNLNEKQWEFLLAVIGGTTVYRKTTPQTPTTFSNQAKNRAEIINYLGQQLYEIDLQQSHIGMEIPPGAQRIRGIAGSGKTVLLCQKAANMYLKHPDWDIALVFFTRSLYSQIENLVDKWLRHFSCGEVTYNRKVQQRLKVLHAWGANNRPGFYREVCEFHNQAPLRVNDTNYRQPNEGLADICKRFLDSDRKLQPMFDAILIDEGQDLVVDPTELEYQGKQAIYWLAYQVLRPLDPPDSKNPKQKRLIWAYDEAQSLDTTAIPSAPTLFGDDTEFQGFIKGTHKGGIKKSEIMRRCYRTPGPILTAAHAIGMGFLCPQGMLAGITNRDEWEAIGYELTGDFRKKGKITLHRSPVNSPNPVPELWEEPVIKFHTYTSRQEELEALAENIRYNLKVDKLQPSKQILVIVLGTVYDAMNLESQVAEFLKGEGIDIFIPSGTRLNQIAPKYPNNDPDTFWYPGGVTVSRIARAKGNEADMVYVVGLDNVAKNSDSTIMRNQLFVAMTRARGWVNMSGTGDYAFYDEIHKVIQSGNTFTFDYNPSRLRSMRDINDADILTVNV